MALVKEISKKEIPDLIKELSNDRRNLFFINNLELYTLSKEIKVYKVDKAFVLNWMDESILLFAPDSYDAKTMIEFLEKQKFNGINGAKEYLLPIADTLRNEFSIEYRQFMMIDKEKFIKPLTRDLRLMELFSPEDYEMLFDLYMRIPLFKDDFKTRDRSEWALEKAELEYPFAGVALSLDNKFVSGAYLGAATRKSAMVVGVGTDPEYENKGFGTSVVSELVDIALNENNIDYLGLWYSDEKAKHLYQKIGFTSIGEYAYFKRKHR